MSWPASAFLDEAFGIGQRLAGAALRHGGRATWLADDIEVGAHGWQPTTRTLGVDLAAGTAGVGWFLARLGAVAPDRNVAAVAAEALRHSVDRIEAGSGRALDWYQGALGVAWAAMDAGRMLMNGELAEAGEGLAASAVQAVAIRGEPLAEPWLVGGEAGLLAGLLAVAPKSNDDQLLEIVDDTANGLARWAQHTDHGSTRVGLARGWTGVGLVLLAWSAATGHALGREIARELFIREREWFEPTVGWFAQPAHAWIPQAVSADRSWCAGAAGIGSARIAAYAAHASIADLADAGASIELVRAGMIGHDDADASLCHGRAGEIELLISAGVLLGEPTHRSAARKAGMAMVGRARARGHYGAGLGPEARNPSLLYGLAGTGLTLLRVGDPQAAPSLTLPPFLVPDRAPPLSTPLAVGLARAKTD